MEVALGREDHDVPMMGDKSEGQINDTAPSTSHERRVEVLINKGADERKN